MADYLKLFKNENEYTQWQNSDNYITPNVCKIEENNTILYNKYEGIDYSTQYLTIESLENDNQVSFANDIMYSTDGSSWDTLTSGESLLLNSGDEVKFKLNNPTVSEYGIGTFSATKQYNVKGNVMSLLYGDDFIGKTDLSMFGGNVLSILFNSSTTLVNAKDLILPATTLVGSCYKYMFEGCTKLTTAPELPSTTLAEYCYHSMFNGCSSLTTAPELPATTLADSCYYRMFNGCSSLTTAPELPATTLANSCYSEMFSGCSSLTTTPDLPATRLKKNCYYGMFHGCKSLTTAPELPATTLGEYCYESMFNGCSKLNNITMLATDISATYCLSNWVSNVASTGTFTKNANMNSLPSGVNGIPEGWTVNNYE